MTRVFGIRFDLPVKSTQREVKNVKPLLPEALRIRLVLLSASSPASNAESSARKKGRFLMERSKRSDATHTWFRLGIVVGVGIAVLLLVNSWSDYVFRSRRVAVDWLRRQIAQQVTTLDRGFQAADGHTRLGLNALLDASLRRSEGGLAWIQIRDIRGTVLAHPGGDPDLEFPPESIKAGFEDRHPLFKISTAGGPPMVVAAFPIRLPAVLSPVVFQRTVAGSRSKPERGHATGVIEAASPVKDTPTIWSLNRDLIINAAGVLALLASLGGMGLSYVNGKRVELQLEIAREVQLDMLPSAQPAAEQFELAADWRTAELVGGDFFDVFGVSRSGCAFVIGDVSGKDIPAALLTGVLHGAVRSSTWTHSAADHEEASLCINRLLYERASRERFASMFWSYFDEETQLLHYVNAGHCPPLLFRSGTSEPVRLTKGGPVLGLLPGAQYEQGVERLEPGDLVVLYSDGVVETANAEGDEFGEGRLVEATERAIRGTSLQIRDSILGYLDGFSAKCRLVDDQTLLVVRFQGAGVVGRSLGVAA